MVRPGSDLSLAARADHVARTVLIRAEERTAAHGTLWLGGLARVERGLGPLGIASHASRPSQLVVVVGAIPITDPLPHVAGHVVQPVPVGRKPRHRPDAREPVLARVVVGKMPLVGVRHPLAPWLERVAPRIELPGETAARRELPLRFGRQALPGPRRIRLRVCVGDVHYRELILPRYRAPWTQGMTPVRALHVRPPLEVVIQRDGVV